MNSQGFLKGMAAGMVLGACAAMVADPISDRQHRKLCKKTEGMFRNIGNIIDTAVDMFRQKIITADVITEIISAFINAFFINIFGKQNFNT